MFFSKRRTTGDGPGIPDWHRKREAELHAALASIPNGPGPSWEVVGGRAVGGLEMVGFAADGHHLLVQSTQGRGVFDCRDGRCVARDAATDWEDVPDQPLAVFGIGPIQGEPVPCSGILGGGLLKVEPIGWGAEVVHLDLLRKIVVLSPCNAIWQMPDRQTGCVRFADVGNVRDVGFSSDGQTSVIATSHNLSVYRRRATGVSL